MKTIQNYPNYMINSKGEIYSLKPKRIVKLVQSVARNGYKVVCLSNNGKQKTIYVHRLVANAYFGAPEKGMQINHIDGNKHNNDVSNLEYVTAQYNIAHYWALKGLVTI